VVVKDVEPTPIVFRKISFVAQTSSVNYHVDFKAVFMPDLRLIIKNQVEKNYPINHHKIQKIKYKIYPKNL